MKQINITSALTQVAGTGARVGQPIVKAGEDKTMGLSLSDTAERRERTGLAPVMPFETLTPLLQKHSYQCSVLILYAATVKVRFLLPP
jgi:hypothetical protein